MISRQFTIVILSALALSGVLLRADDTFTCPAGREDMMKYFVMAESRRASEYVTGNSNSIYTQVFPNRDFASAGYWLWLKSAAGNGFDVKAFGPYRIFMRATELTWTDNTSFKRFVHDLPIAERCVAQGQPGEEIRVGDTKFEYYESCKAYKSSDLGSAVNDLDAPVLMNAGGGIGKAWTRVLHYHYNCDREYKNCQNEEQFFLANGWGIWQWKHFRNGTLVKTTLMNQVQQGSANGTLPCPESYKP